MSLADFSHLTEHQKGTMVDVSGKTITDRRAVVAGGIDVGATCAGRLSSEAIATIATTAQVAGVMAAKSTSDLIPYCHPIALTKVDVECTYHSTGRFDVVCTARTSGQTGVEMEALIGAQIAAATIYDMIKAVAPEAEIGPFRVMEKVGGKTGHWQRT